MVRLTQTAVKHRAPDASTASDNAYRLFWRMRASSPWRREVFTSREEAFDRFFYLLGKGIEIRWGQAETSR